MNTGQGPIDRRTDRRRTKWSLCAAILRRWHKKKEIWQCTSHETQKGLITIRKWKLRDNTKMPIKALITQRLWTNLGRTVSWCNYRHLTGVVKPAYRIPTLPLTTLFSHFVHVHEMGQWKFGQASRIYMNIITGTLVQWASMVNYRLNDNFNRCIEPESSFSINYYRMFVTLYIFIYIIPGTCSSLVTH